MIDWKDKKVLVTGAEGLIGRELVIELKELGADVITFDLKTGQNVLKITDCDDYCMGVDYVFHLFGVKGNPKKTKERPVDFMYPMLIGDTNMIRAAQVNKVKKFLYTSSIAVENPESDKYPAWAKMTAENLLEATKIQEPDFNYVIVRPANVYGRFDDFNNPDAMVVTSLINKAMRDGELTLDKKGSEQIRDFINAKDVARGMIKAMMQVDNTHVNLCSGKGVSINDIANVIQDELDIPIYYEDLNLTLGPDKKVMELDWDFTPEIDIKQGIKEVILHGGEK